MGHILIQVGQNDIDKKVLVLYQHIPQANISTPTTTSSSSSSTRGGPKENGGHPECGDEHVGVAIAHGLTHQEKHVPYAFARDTIHEFAVVENET